MGARNQKNFKVRKEGRKNLRTENHEANGKEGKNPGRVKKVGTELERGRARMKKRGCVLNSKETESHFGERTLSIGIYLGQNQSRQFWSQT